MKIIIHGGFFSESHTNQATKLAKQNALKEIARKGFEFLQNHTALETVVYAVSLLEDDELFNAGIGSQIQSDGKIRMSASLMDGSSQKMSGVINIENVKNPIQVAEKLLTYDDKVLEVKERPILHVIRVLMSFQLKFRNVEKNIWLKKNPPEPERLAVLCLMVKEIWL